MSRSAIRHALEPRLANLAPSWPTEWENTAFVAPANTYWQRVRLLVADTVPLGAGPNGGEEWKGTLHVMLWGPAGGGPKLVEDRADLIRGNRAKGIVGHFYAGQSLSADGANITVLQPVDGPVIESDPKWYGLPVLIPFVCHLV